MSLDAAERAIREGQLDAAMRGLQEQVRKDPSNANLRVFLFQLFAVMGDWDRAQTQLSVAGDLDAKALAMVQMYREAIICERLRADVFAGKKSPLVFGEPEPWLAWMIEALLVAGTPRSGQAAELRAQAFEAAPASGGTIDGRSFDWIADADMRLGPVCEAVINGKYYWVPFARLSRIVLEAPVDLRDLVWLPAHFEFANGGEAVGVIPTRYPGSESADDHTVRLGRKTVWTEHGPDVFFGLGQRLFSTETGEHSLMDTRDIRIGNGEAHPPQAPSHG